MGAAGGVGLGRVAGAGAGRLGLVAIRLTGLDAVRGIIGSRTSARVGKFGTIEISMTIEGSSPISSSFPFLNVPRETWTTCLISRTSSFSAVSLWVCTNSTTHKGLVLR